MHNVLASPVAGHCRKIGSRTHVAHLDPGLLECFRVRRWQGSDKGEPCTSIPVYQGGAKNRIGGFLEIVCKLMEGWEKEVFLGGCDRYLGVGVLPLGNTKPERRRDGESAT